MPRTGRPAKSVELQKMNPAGRRRAARSERKNNADQGPLFAKTGKPVEIHTYTDAELRRICRTKIPHYNPWKTRGDCKFDVAKARGVVEFFHQQLTHVKGGLATKPFILERWQIAIVGNLFGWIRPDGTRRYRHALIYVPRKNGKTALCAGILLYVLCEDGERGAEIYGAASEYKQACFVFHHARGMVLQNPFYFANKLKIYNGQDKAITYEDQLSTYQVMSSDAGSKHGGNTHFCVVDELHTLPNSDLVDTIDTSTGARENPLIAYLTTSDYDRPGSICNKTHDYAKKVIEGTVDDPYFLPVVFEASIDDDWTNPRVWAKANPNLGVSVRHDYIDSTCKKAQESRSDENKFKRLHLNIRTQQDERWLDLDRWDECVGDIDRERLKGRQCFAGLDLASTKDLNALCLTFPFPDHYESLWWFWSPRKTAEIRSRRDKAPYLDWSSLKGFELTDGNETDYRLIRKQINEIYDVYPFQKLAIDRLFQGAQLSQDLADDGIEIVAFGQGFVSMAAPTAEFERLINRAEYHHGGFPPMRWMVSHVAYELDAAGNMKPSKAKSTEKIDGIVAGIMALGLAMSERDSGTSVYDQPGRMSLQ